MFGQIALSVAVTLSAIGIAWFFRKRNELGMKKRATLMPEEPKVDTARVSEPPVKSEFDDDETVVANTTEVNHRLIDRVRRAWVPVRIDLYPEGPWSPPPPPLDPELDVQEPKVIYYGFFPKAFSEFYTGAKPDSEFWPGRGGERVKLVQGSELVRALERLGHDSYGQNFTEEELAVLKSGSADIALLGKLWVRGPTLNELAESIILSRTEELARTIESNLELWRKDVSVRVRGLVGSGHAITAADLEMVTDLGAGTFSLIKEAIALIELQSKLVREPETFPPPIPKE